MTIAGIHHVAILVEDLERAERFYSGVLGLALDRRWPDDAGGTRSIWLKVPGGSIVMLERAAGGDARRGAMGPGWHVLAFSITAEAAKEIEAGLSRAGVAIDSRTKHTLYLRDPEGNRVALSAYPDVLG